MLCFCLISKATFITWRRTAYCVKGMFSKFQILLQSICPHVSFTLSWILTRSYKTMMNLSIILNCQDFSTNIKKILYITQRNDSVFLEKHFDASHANMLVFYKIQRWFQLLWGHEREVTMQKIVFQYW